MGNPRTEATVVFTRSETSSPSGLPATARPQGFSGGTGRWPALPGGRAGSSHDRPARAAGWSGGAWRGPGTETETDAAVLTRTFGFTASEARVALLLAHRYSNREIAQELRVTEHTARRHTEKILLKLGIHSRRVVRDIVQTTLAGIGDRPRAG